jgi:hypothetical protein
MVTSPLLSSVRSLLECYLRAKDLNQPALISECFATDAELTFSIATDDIDFPRLVAGAPAIAKTLVADFGERFDRCRTYYICVEPHLNESRTCEMPWLVIMREKETESLRIGNGTYRWRFSADAGNGGNGGNGGMIVQLHIHIERMDAVPDLHAEKLNALQGRLSYPWLSPEELQRSMAGFIETYPDSAFAKPFEQTAAL